jgi:hypothetical protein
MAYLADHGLVNWDGLKAIVAMRSVVQVMSNGLRRVVDLRGIPSHGV